MMIGWPGGVGQANGARGAVPVAYRSRLRNEFAEVDPSGRRRAEGRFGAVWTVRDKEEVGTRD